MDGEPAARGYRIPRVTWYLGRWIRSTDWYPDYQLRLYDRRAGRLERPAGARVGRAARDARACCTHPLQHYAYRDISHHLATIDRYTTLAAEQWMAEGRRTNAGRGSASTPTLAFLRNYVLAEDSRTARAGLLVSILNSYYVFLKFAKLWELQRAARRQQVTAAADASSLSQPEPEPRSPANPEHGPTSAAASLRPECSRSTSTPRGRGAAGRTRCSSPSWACARSAIARMLVAHPGRRAAPAREGGARPAPAGAAHRDGSRRGMAAVAGHQAAQAGHRPRARSSRRRDGGARAVDEHAAREAAAGRVAARRLPPARQLALALEVSAGRLLHLRVGRDPADARR